MKSFFKIVIIFILTPYFSSCSLKEIDRRGISMESDLLYQESLARRSRQDLRQMARQENSKTFSHLVAQCYLGEEQESEFQEHYAKQRQNPLYWVARGACQQASGNHPKALYYYSLAERLPQLDRLARSIIENNKGVIALAHNHFSSALHHFKASLEQNKSHTATLNTALVYMHFGHLTNAYNLITPLHRVNPSDPEALFTLATIYALQGDWQKSELTFNKISGDLLRRSDMAPYYALTLYMQGKDEEAFQVLARSEFTQIRNLRLFSEELRTNIERRLASKREEARQRD